MRTHRKVAAKRRVYSALLSFVSWDGVFRWWRPALYLFRRRFLRRDWGGRCTAFPRRSAFSNSCSLAGGRRLAAGRRLALGRRFPVVRRFEVARRFVVVRRFAGVRRFTGRRFFRDEREVAARFLRFAICCLLIRASTLTKKIFPQRGDCEPRRHFTVSASSRNVRR
jgi:hypothetical protein